MLLFVTAAAYDPRRLHLSTVRVKQPQIRGRHMSYTYKLNEDVRHQLQGPQGRAAAAPAMIYTVVQLMPIEADRIVRYRIKCKSENFERVVTEDQLSLAWASRD
jgi:hypothetical protein